MPEENSDDKNKLDRLPQPDSRPEARVDETSLIKPSGAAPIVSIDQVAYNYYSATPPEETSTIRENWRKIRKRKWLVLAVTVIVTTIVTVESFRTKTTYQATAKVALTNDNPAIFKLGATTLGVDNNDRLKTEMLLLRTYPLLAKVVVRYGLNEDPAFLQADERKTIMEAARTIIAKFTGSISQKDGQENAGGQPTFDSPPPQIDGPLSPEEVERLASYIARLDDSLYVSQIEETRASPNNVPHTEPGVPPEVGHR